MKFGVLFSVFAAIVSALPLQEGPLNKRAYPSFEAYSNYKVDRTDLETFLDKQKEVSLYYLLQNIAYPEGQFNNGVPGTVIASPSTSNPDYYYQWTRDSAITFLTVLSELEDNNFNTTLAKAVEYYINTSYNLQRTSNPSGSFDDENHKGLGEPKFNTDGSAYTGAWGRPQNDGPALRAYAISRYLNDVNSLNEGKLVLTDSGDINFSSTEDIYKNIIKPDLEYVIGYWDSTGFDLWEENQGRHFFTSLVQQKALAYAVDIAKSFDDGDFANTLSSTASTLESYLSGSDGGFVNTDVNHIVENPDLLQQNSRQGLDSATYIGPLLTHDIGESSSTPFDVDNEYVLQSYYLLLEDNKDRYSVNSAYSAGAAIGRYPEDVYNGDGSSEGNPWFLATAYAAQVPYKLAYDAKSASNDITINKINYDFFNKYIVDLSTINSAYQSSDSVTIKSGSDEFNTVADNLVTFGDSFLQVILEYINDDGSLNEQLNRYTGYSTGAYSLTWSSGALLEAIRLRNKVKALA